MTNTENNFLRKIRFNSKSFIIACILFIIEIVIALFFNDPIIRPYVGDVLVVILIYYFIKSFFKIKPSYLIIGVIIFAYFIEIGQYYNLVKILGFENNRIMSTIIGTGFSWIDLIAYTIGGVICYYIENKRVQGT